MQTSFVVWAAAITVAITLTSVHHAQGGCPSFLETYYEELGCRPEGKDNQGCATSYDCGSLTGRKKDRCYYRGKDYKERQTLEDNVSPPCMAACTCLPSEDRLGFNCAHVECPELFGGRLPDGCYRTYEHDKCCMTKQICGEEKTPQTKCEYKGKFYREGERFYPEEEPCMQCICQSGYNGSLVEPVCRKISCSLELVSAEDLARGCVPVFYGEKSCCPIDWRCPEDSDSVVAANTKTSEAKDKTCSFGRLKLQVGERLSAGSEEGVTCSCRVPPHLTCVQQPDP